MKLRPLLALFLPLLLPLAALADGERVAYACDNNSHIDISFSADISGRPQATLYFADTAVVLPQVLAATGAQYRSGDIRLNTKGDDAIFEDGKGNLRRCSRGSVAPSLSQAASAAPALAAASSSFIDIAGSATYLARIALPPDAVLNIRIQAGKRTLVEQRYELNGAQVPIPFSATVDRDLIGKNTRIAITAHIDAGGKTEFVSAKVYLVMKNKLPQPVNITLKPAGRRKGR